MPQRFSDTQLQAFYAEFKEHIRREEDWISAHDKLDMLYHDFKDHIVREDEWRGSIENMLLSNAALKTVVDEIRQQMPDIKEVVTRWTQAKGIFWFVSIGVFAAIGVANAWKWLLDAVFRLFHGGGQ